MWQIHSWHNTRWWTVVAKIKDSQVNFVTQQWQWGSDNFPSFLSEIHVCNILYYGPKMAAADIAMPREEEEGFSSYATLSTRQETLPQSPFANLPSDPVGQDSVTCLYLQERLQKWLWACSTLYIGNWALPVVKKGQVRVGNGWNRVGNRQHSQRFLGVYIKRKKVCYQLSLPYWLKFSITFIIRIK